VTFSSSCARRVPTWLAASLALLLSVPAAAQGTDATAASAARALFTEGVSLADDGHWSEAIARFRRALALRDSSVIAFNLGVALAHDGHPVEAAEIFRRVIRSDTTDAALRADATAALAEAEPDIAWANLSYAGRTEGLTLTVAGVERPVALVGARVPLDAGTHEITLTRADGAVVGRGSVTVEAGATTDVALAVIDAPIESSDEIDVTHIVVPVAPPPSDDTGLWVGVGVGAGVVLAVAAIVLVVVLVPPSEPAPFAGSLGTVEIGR
jgi:hypothetical protein